MDDYDDILLQHFKRLSEHQIICNLYLSYMQAIDFILLIGFEKEYQEFADANEKNQRKKKSAEQKYIDYLQKKSGWQKTDN